MEQFCLAFNKDGSVMLQTEDSKRALNAAMQRNGYILVDSAQLMNASILCWELGSAKAANEGCVKRKMPGKEFMVVEHGPHKAAPSPFEEAAAVLSGCAIPTVCSLVEAACGFYTANRLGALLLEKGQNKLIISEYKTGQGADKCSSHDAHVDSGLLTFVVPTANCLEVEVKGVWRSVKHGCGMAVALPGKTLEEMTGARIKATNYRMGYKHEHIQEVRYMVQLHPDTYIDTSYGATTPFRVAEITTIDIHDNMLPVSTLPALPATPATAGPKPPPRVPPVSPAAGSSAPKPHAAMTVVFVDRAGNRVTFTARATKSFASFFKAYCEHKNIPKTVITSGPNGPVEQDGAQFTYKGRKLLPTDTPRAVGMTDGDHVDVVVLDVPMGNKVVQVLAEPGAAKSEEDKSVSVGPINEQGTAAGSTAAGDKRAGQGAPSAAAAAVKRVKREKE